MPITVNKGSSPLRRIFLVPVRYWKRFLLSDSHRSGIYLCIPMNRWVLNDSAIVRPRWLSVVQFQCSIQSQRLLFDRLVPERRVQYELAWQMCCHTWCLLCHRPKYTSNRSDVRRCKAILLVERMNSVRVRHSRERIPMFDWLHSVAELPYHCIIHRVEIVIDGMFDNCLCTYG